MFPSRWLVKKSIGDDAILWINPRKISFSVGVNDPCYKAIHGAIDKFLPKQDLISRLAASAMTPFWIPKDTYAVPEAVEKNEKFKLLQDFKRHLECYQNSRWYLEHVRRIEKNGLSQHKKLRISTIKELDEFFESYAIPLFDTMNQEGYLQGMSEDYPLGTIGENGEIHKANAGNHRFAVAFIVGTERFPVMIKGVHESFFKQFSHKWIFRKSNVIKLLKEVERLHQ